MELGLHAGLLRGIRVDPAVVETTPISPTTRAYTNYLLAMAYGGSLAQGLATLPPCCWIRVEMGPGLLCARAPDPRYLRRLATYGDEKLDTVVADVLELLDRTGFALGAAKKTAGHFAIAARYELMFWDAAYQGEDWSL